MAWEVECEIHQWEQHETSHELHYFQFENALLTASVELDSSLERNLVLVGRSLVVCLFCCIQTINIGLVMLLVMEGHNLLRDIWLQGL